MLLRSCLALLRSRLVLLRSRLTLRLWRRLALLLLGLPGAAACGAA